MGDRAGALNPAERAEKARNLFTGGANCAQAVLVAFLDETQLDEDTAMRLASGFGGGLARLREVCGAVSGMTMTAGLLNIPGGSDDKAAKDAQYAFVRKLIEEFRAETGSIICRELLGLDKKENDSPVSEARTPEYYRKRPCAELVALAAEILAKELEHE